MAESAPAGLRYAPHLVVASVGYVTFGYSAVPTLIVERFDASLVSVGLLMSAILLAYGLVQFPAGRFFETSGTTRPLLVGTVLHAALSVGLDFAPTFESLLALRFVWGLVGGVLVTGGATHVARLYSGPAATRMQGLYGGVLTLGGALGFVVVPAVTARTGWVGLHSVGAVLAIPAAAALFVHARGPAAGHTQPAAISDTTGTVDVRAILASPAVLVASVCYVAVLSSYITLSTFVTTYFEEAGVLVSLNAIVLALAGFARVAGGIGTEWGQVEDTRAIAVSGAAGVAGFLGLAVAGHPLLVATLPMVTMIAVSAPFGPIYNVAAGAEVGEGPGLGVVLAVGNLAALVFPTVTGAVRETTGSYGGAFALLAGANLVAVAAAVWLGRR